MTITLISSTKSAGTAGSTTPAINTTGANFIAIAIAGGNAVETVSDSKGNTYTALTTQTTSGPDSVLYYCVSPTVGTGHTFTNAATSSFSVIMVAAFSGLLTSGTFDVQNGATSGATVTSIQTGSITPSANNELIVSGFAGNVGATSISIDSGFTIVQSSPYNAGTSYAGGLAYFVQSTASAVNPAWSWPTLDFPNAATIASFKGTAAIASASTPKFFSLSGL